jgi:hypothetical protein
MHENDDLYEELSGGLMELYESDVPDMLKPGNDGGAEREQFGATEDGGHCVICEGRGVLVICGEEACRAGGDCFHDGGTADCPSCGGAQ